MFCVAREVCAGRHFRFINFILVPLLTFWIKVQECNLNCSLIAIKGGWGLQERFMLIEEFNFVSWITNATNNFIEGGRIPPRCS